MIVHYGNRTVSGHYYSLIKVCDRWFKFDDDKITFVEESGLQPILEKAYLLFY